MYSYTKLSKLGEEVDKLKQKFDILGNKIIWFLAELDEKTDTVTPFVYKVDSR